MANRSYTDAEKAKYWREKAINGAKNINSGQKVYQTEKKKYKVSGAIFSKITKGEREGLHVVTAWKKTKTTMLRANCFPISSTSTESAKGNQYIPYLVTIIDMSTLQSTKYNAIMNIQTKVLVINDLSMCITPNGSGKTKSGVNVKGYFGRNYQ